MIVAALAPSAAPWWNAAAPRRLVYRVRMPEEGSGGARDPRQPHTSTPDELRAIIAAQRAGLPFLQMRDAAGRQRLHELRPGGAAVTVGRRPANDVCLAWDGAVSSVHAQLEYVGDEWVVVDDGLSSFGTFHNGQRVQGRKRLRHGDRLRLGDTMIVFNTSESDPPVATAAGVGGDADIDLTRVQHLVLVALCRPILERPSAAPAKTSAIADELFLTPDAVKKQLGTLYKRFGLQDLGQNDKRAELAALALHHGFVSKRDVG